MNALSLSSPDRMAARPPTYLRVMVTATCPMTCPFCHAEGETVHRGELGDIVGLPLLDVKQCLTAAVRAGILKFKFLGGEPLMRRDLTEIIRHLRGLAPFADLSLITSGAGRPESLAALFAAGLDRANLSIHGWTRSAFAARGGNEGLFELRHANLRYLLARDRTFKVNYVFRGAGDEADLALLLEWAAGKPVVINVLDDLHDPQASALSLTEALVRIRGAWARQLEEIDPHSLATTHLRWNDGLTIEIKTSRLGDLAPWRECTTGCAARASCREGIFALRLSTAGDLRLCMDRPDLRLPLSRLVRESGPERAASVWRAFVREHAEP